MIPAGSSNDIETTQSREIVTQCDQASEFNNLQWDEIIYQDYEALEEDPAEDQAGTSESVPAQEEDIASQSAAASGTADSG
jgi:hypothetical protein